jgi:hypothetical protein
LRKRFAGAGVFVDHNSNALAIGFGPSECPSETFLSIAEYPHSVSICFLQGVNLSDLQRALIGNGKQVRNTRLENVKTLDKPVIGALISDAVADGGKPLLATRSERIIIKRISAKQHPGYLSRLSKQVRK